MTNEEKMIIDADNRSKSAIKMISEVKDDVGLKFEKVDKKFDEFDRKLDNTNELIANFKVMAVNMENLACSVGSINEHIAKVDNKVETVADQVNELKNHSDKIDANKWRNAKKMMVETVLKESIKAIVVAGIAILATMIATGQIK